MTNIIITSPEELNAMIQQAVEAAFEKLHSISPTPSSDKYLSIDDAARYLSLAKQTLYALTSKRAIPFIKRTKRILFLKEDLDNWLNDGIKKSCIKPPIITQK